MDLRFSVETRVASCHWDSSASSCGTIHLTEHCQRSAPAESHGFIVHISFRHFRVSSVDEFYGVQRIEADVIGLDANHVSLPLVPGG